MRQQQQCQVAKLGPPSVACIGCIVVGCTPARLPWLEATAIAWVLQESHGSAGACGAVVWRRACQCDTFDPSRLVQTLLAVGYPICLQFRVLPGRGSGALMGASRVLGTVHATQHVQLAMQVAARESEGVGYSICVERPSARLPSPPAWHHGSFFVYA